MPPPTAWVIIIEFKLPELILEGRPDAEPASLHSADRKAAALAGLRVRG
jgi:hypothetical protein